MIRSVALALSLAALGASAQERTAPRTPGDCGAPSFDDGTFRHERLERGGQVTYTVQGLERVAVGDESVLDVRVVSGEELLVTALDRGTTSLILWFRGGCEERWRLEVVDTARLEALRGSLAVLGLAEAITARQVGEKLVVSGRVPDLETYRRYRQLLEHEAGIVDLVKVSPEVNRELVARIDHALAAAGLAHVTVRPVGDTLFLEGAVESEAERERAERIVRAVREAEGVAGPR